MPPLRPDAPTAHRWLSEELAKASYQDGRSLADRLSDWLNSLFVSGSPVVPPVRTLVAVALVGLLLVIIVFVIRRFRADRRPARSAKSITESDVGPLDDPARHRQAAAQQRAAGNYAAAVIESFRAIVAAAAERHQVQVIPGLTAQGAAHQLVETHPQNSTELQRAADCFDRARYADARPSGPLITADDATAVAELEQQLASIRADHAGGRIGR